MDGCCSTHIEEIVTRAAVSAPLFASEVGKAMLDANALTETRSAPGRRHELPKAVPKLLVVGDRHGTSRSGRGFGAPRPEVTARARIGVKLDDRAGRDALISMKVKTTRGIL